MPKYGASREMSQSASAWPPEPVSHSRALLTTCGCSLPGSSSHWRRNSTQRGSDSLKKKCEELFSSGRTPVSAEYGLMRSVGAYTVLQTSQASPYWSGVWQLGHSPLI